MNPFSLLRSLFQRRRAAAAPPASQKVEPEHSLSHSPGKTEPISQEKFREMFAAMLADPESRKAFLPGLTDYLPIEGGTPCTSITSSGNAAANYLAKFTAACNIEASAVNEVSGKVGIGVASPQSPLHVLGPNTAASGDANYTIAAVDSTAVGQGVGGGILFSGFYTATARADFANIRGVKENNTSGNYASALIFDTRINGGSETERMRISSAGNVGIGNTNPQAKLDVTGGMNASGSVVIGGTATKQSNNGPEKLSVQDADALKVAVAAFVGSETNARLLIDMNGNHEWSSDGNDQTVVLGCTAIGRMNLVGYPLGSSAGGGLGIVAWKWSYLTMMVNSTTTSFPVHDTAPFTGVTRIRVENEICDLTSIGVGTLNVTRGQEGTTAVSHPMNATVVAIGTEEAQPRILLLNDGSGIMFSDGSNATDALVSRPATGQIFIGPNALVAQASGNLGFYGTTPVTKPTVTGSRGGNAALQSLLTALAALGLIVDSTS